MDGNRYYGVRVEGAKYGVCFGPALAIAISYTANHSILWAIPRHFGLAVCDLLRTVLVIVSAPQRPVTLMRTANFSCG